MTRFRPGLYEQLISERLEAELSELDESLIRHCEPLRHAEAADRLAAYLRR